MPLLLISYALGGAAKSRRPETLCTAHTQRWLQIDHPDFAPDDFIPGQIRRLVQEPELIFLLFLKEKKTNKKKTTPQSVKLFRIHGTWAKRSTGGDMFETLLCCPHVHANVPTRLHLRLLRNDTEHWRTPHA